MYSLSVARKLCYLVSLTITTGSGIPAWDLVELLTCELKQILQKYIISKVKKLCPRTASRDRNATDVRK